MDYLKIYDNLISGSRNRVLEGYSENHHIIPKCLGGTDEKSNMVRLTAEEHYIAHLLLVKIHPNNHKLVFAANMMCAYSKDSGRKHTNKRYGWLRRRLAEATSKMNKGKMPGNKGIPITEDHREKLQTTWIFTFPDGREEIHKGLREFCQTHSLNQTTMSAVCKGIRSHHKGFKCMKLDNIKKGDNNPFLSKPRKSTGKSPYNSIKVLIAGIEYDSIHKAMVRLNLKRHEIERLNEY